MKTLIIVLSLMFHEATYACNGLEKRVLNELENGTPAQKLLFEKIQNGQDLNENEKTIFDEAQIESLRNMHNELQEIIDQSSVAEAIDTPYSGACIDSTLALSDMVENGTNADQSLKNVTASYP